MCPPEILHNWKWNGQDLIAEEFNIFWFYCNLLRTVGNNRVRVPFYEWMHPGGLFVSCLPHLLHRPLVSQTWQTLSSLTHTQGSVMWIIYGSRAKNRRLHLTSHQCRQKNNQLSHNLPSYTCWLYVGFPPSVDEIGVTVKPKATCGSDLMFIQAFFLTFVG